MLTSAVKLTVFFGCLLFALCILNAEAGRTHYDQKIWSITVKGCDGEECSYKHGVSKVTVQNDHWHDYHGTPPRKTSGHDDGHGSELRDVYISEKTIIRSVRCDGTDCP